MNYVLLTLYLSLLLCDFIFNIPGEENIFSSILLHD